MPSILKVTANWSGFVGSPGYTNMYGNTFVGNLEDDAQNLATAVRGLFAAEPAAFPSIVRIQIDSEVQIIDDATGELQNVVSVDGGAAVAGTGTGNYSAAVGAIINWSTGTIRNGRRMRGRTFLVPLAGSAFDATGSLSTTQHNAWNIHADNYLANPLIEPVIWGRPRPDLADGVSGPITSANVPDMAAVLRSRRD